MFSTFKLKILQLLYKKPIYVIFFYNFKKINLRKGFLLRCFQ